jgi:hypothetical protein
MIELPPIGKFDLLSKLLENTLSSLLSGRDDTPQPKRMAA